MLINTIVKKLYNNENSQWLSNSNDSNVENEQWRTSVTFKTIITSKKFKEMIERMHE